MQQCKFEMQERKVEMQLRKVEMQEEPWSDYLTRTLATFVPALMT